MVYVLSNGRFKLIGQSELTTMVNTLACNPKDKFRFIRVDNYTIKEVGKEKGKIKLINSSIYLGGLLIKRRYDRVMDIEDVEEAKKELTCFYKLDGREYYYPNIPFTTPELLDMFGGWFSMQVIGGDEEDDLQRFALITYNWKQHIIDKPKVLNQKATERFGRELYGDVLYINENYVS